MLSGDHLNRFACASHNMPVLVLLDSLPSPPLDIALDGKGPISDDVSSLSWAAHSRTPCSLSLLRLLQLPSECFQVFKKNRTATAKGA
jgi:hypothetical protein